MKHRDPFLSDDWKHSSHFPGVWRARTQTLEVLRLENGGWVVVAAHDGDASVSVEPFDAVPLDLFRLWGRSAPES